MQYGRVGKWGLKLPEISLGLWHKSIRSASVWVLVLPPRAGLGRWGLWRPLEQEAEVGRDERVGRRHHVGVVHGPVLAREGDPARVLAQPVLELGPDLA